MRPMDLVVKQEVVIIVTAIIAMIRPSNQIDRYQLEVVIRLQASISLHPYLVANFAAQPLCRCDLVKAASLVSIRPVQKHLASCLS